MMTTDSTPGAHYLWTVHVDYRDGTTETLGTVECYSETYGDRTDADGLALLRGERTRVGEMWLFREHELPVADVRRWRVTLDGATNLAAALPELG